MDLALSPLWLTLAASASTMGGGALALLLRERLRPLLAFAVGAILGMVAFDLLPEILAISRAHGFASASAAAMALLGFLLLHGTDRLLAAGRPGRAHHDGHREGGGLLPAMVLVAHSVMDGLAIGIGWQAAPQVGLAVAIAVIAHDFADGLNTVGVMLRHRHPARRAVAMLLLDAGGPVAGAAATVAFRAPPFASMLCLGFFAGSLLYVGVSDLLPPVYARVRGLARARLVAMTAGGVVFSWGVLRALS